MKMAKQAEIRHNDGFYLDGELFPWYIAESATVETKQGEVSTVTVTIFVDGPVEVVPK